MPLLGSSRGNICELHDLIQGGSVVSTVASEQEGPGFESRSFHLIERVSWVWYPVGVLPFCVDFAHSPHVCMGTLPVLQLPFTVQRHAGKVNWWVSAWMIVCLYMSALWWTGDSFSVYPECVLAQCQLGMAPAPTTLKRISGCGWWMNEWTIWCNFFSWGHELIKKQFSIKWFLIQNQISTEWTEK